MGVFSHGPDKISRYNKCMITIRGSLLRYQVSSPQTSAWVCLRPEIGLLAAEIRGFYTHPLSASVRLLSHAAKGEWGYFGGIQDSA